MVGARRSKDQRGWDTRAPDADADHDSLEFHPPCLTHPAHPAHPAYIFSLSTLSHGSAAAVGSTFFSTTMFLVL